MRPSLLRLLTILTISFSLSPLFAGPTFCTLKHWGSCSWFGMFWCDDDGCAGLFPPPAQTKCEIGRLGPCNFYCTCQVKTRGGTIGTLQPVLMSVSRTGGTPGSPIYAPQTALALSSQTSSGGTIQWYAPQGAELLGAASAANGLGAQTVAVSSAYAIRYCAHWEE